MNKEFRITSTTNTAIIMAGDETMRLSRIAFFLAFTLLSVAPAIAQESSMRGTFTLAITVDGVRYKLPVGNYTVSSSVVQGQTVQILNVWVSSADAQAAGLPSGSTLKGKTAVRPRFFKKVADGQYYKITMSDVLISGVAGSNTGGITLQLNLGGQDFELIGDDLGIISPRDAASGLPTGKAFKFSGRPLALGGNDWD
jgi:hypothetical protein